MVQLFIAKEMKTEEVLMEAKYFGKRYRVRKLADGRWVPEMKVGYWPFKVWVGCEKTSKLSLTWRPGSRHYHNCVVKTFEEAVSILSEFGA